VSFTLLRIVVLALGLIVAGCTSLPLAPVGNTDFQANEKALLTRKDWSLQGRLGVRQENQSDSVALVWKQQDQQFDLVFRSTLLGLGTTHVYGTVQRVTVEKAGEQPVTLPGLQALTKQYLSFEFPAAYLVYWVRGLPVPNVAATPEFDEHSRLISLVQRDDKGRGWQLQYDRYTEVETLVLPGRIKMNTDGLQLTFVIDKWQPGAAP